MPNYGRRLENLLPVWDFNRIMENIGEYNVFVKLYKTEKREKILDFVRNLPLKGLERAEKEANIECIIIDYEGREYFTENPSYIGDFISAAMEDLEARSELREEAKKRGFDIFKPEAMQP